MGDSTVLNGRTQVVGGEPTASAACGRHARIASLVDEDAAPAVGSLLVSTLTRPAYLTHPQHFLLSNLEHFSNFELHVYIHI